MKSNRIDTYNEINEVRDERIIGENSNDDESDGSRSTSQFHTYISFVLNHSSNQTNDLKPL